MGDFLIRITAQSRRELPRHVRHAVRDRLEQAGARRVILSSGGGRIVAAFLLAAKDGTHARAEGEDLVRHALGAATADDAPVRSTAALPIGP